MTWMNVINHSYCLPHLHLSLCIVVMYYVNMVNHKVAPYIATGTQDSNWVSTIARIWILRSKILFLFFIADSFLLSLMLFSSKLCPGHLKWILHSRFKYELVCFQKRNCRTKSGRVTVVWICLTDTWLCVAVRGSAWLVGAVRQGLRTIRRSCERDSCRVATTWLSAFLRHHAALWESAADMWTPAACCARDSRQEEHAVDIVHHNITKTWGVCCVTRC